MEQHFDKEAHMFCEAIKKLAADEYALDNLENYLGRHFPEWLAKFANTPAGIAEELKEFSKITKEENI